MKLKPPFNHEHSERELSEELQFHLEQEVQNNLAQGMSEEEACRQARLSFGAVDAVKDNCRELRVGSWFEATLRDFGYGWRLLRKSPGFACVAVAILALGIGANTAMFSAVNAVLLARCPFPRPEKLVIIAESADRKEVFTRVSIANFEDYVRDQKTFEQLALWLSQSVNLTGQDRPDRLGGMFISANYFDLFGARSAMGRLFLPGDDQPGAANVAVLSDEAWQTRFGADPKILGRHLTLNNESYAVVGVLPRGYKTLFESDVYLPAQHYTNYSRERSVKSLIMIGRVKNDTSLAEAEADLDHIAQRLARDYPKENPGIHINLTEFRQALTGSVRKPLLVLLGAVALVLLITCANLANLLLARGMQRQREMAVRIALGAKRSRIIRQLVSETMLLAAIGGLLGILLAFLALPLLVRMAPSTFRDVQVAIDGRVLLFTSLLTLITGLLFGIVPALQLSQASGNSTLSSGVRGTVQKAMGSNLRAVFVVCQMAISLVLLVAAGLMIRSFEKLMTSETGISAPQLLTMEYRLPRNKYPKPEAQAALHRELSARVAQVPGVISSAIVQALPFSGNYEQRQFTVAGSDLPVKGKEPGAFTNRVTPEYFATMGIPLLRGRNFNDHDDPASPPVVVISRAVADSQFTGQDPIGRSLHLIDPDPKVNNKTFTIVGVVGDAKQLSLRDSDKSELYFPYSQQPDIFGTLVVRTAFNPMTLAEPVRQAVWSVDRDQPVWRVRTIQFLINRDLEDERLLMTLMTGFGVLAVILTALGTYGVLSNIVTQRRQEIGIRMALGADRGAVRNMVLRQGMKLAYIGTAIGALGAAAASRIIASQLYGVGALDLAAYSAAWMVMLGIAFLASYLPARRATHVDPAVALRYE